MILSQNIENFTDERIEDILSNGSIDTGLISMSRPYSFSLSSTQFNFNEENYFVHYFDQSIYPTTLTSATGFGIYATNNNSYSGYFFGTVMQLFNFGVLEDTNGLYSTTSITGSSTSNFLTIGRFNSNYYNGDDTEYISLSASITGFYVYNFDRSIYGDKIFAGTLSAYNDVTLLAYDNFGNNDYSIYSLSSVYYSNNSLTSVTQFWVMPDIGKIIVWSSDDNILNSLSAIDNFQFRNSLSVQNTTINIRVEPNEFNASNNMSYYLTDFNGELPDTYISAVYLFNPWNDCIAIAKLPKPIRKIGNIPLTFKISFDSI